MCFDTEELVYLTEIYLTQGCGQKQSAKHKSFPNFFCKGLRHYAADSVLGQAILYAGSSFN